ncbi:mCG146008, partial [Mus musculus]
LWASARQQKPLCLSSAGEPQAPALHTPPHSNSSPHWLSANLKDFFVLADLELVLKTRLSWNSQRSACLCSVSAGIKGM